MGLLQEQKAEIVIPIPSECGAAAASPSNNNKNAISSKGATSSLLIDVFLIAFAILFFLMCIFGGFSTKPSLATAIFSAVSFLLGAVASIIPSATYAHARNTLEMGAGAWRFFILAFRSCVIGALQGAICLPTLYIATSLFKLYYGDQEEGLAEASIGYMFCFYAITVRYNLLQLSHIGLTE